VGALLDAALSSLSTWTRGFKITSDRTAGIFGIRESASGREVGPTDALSLSAIFCGLRLLSDVIGMLPLNVFQVDSKGNKFPATNDPAYPLLKTSPNPWMTAKTFRGTMEFLRRLWGNAYAEIRWTMGGRAKELWLIEPWRVKPEIIDGDLFYIVDSDRQNPIAKEDMLHIPLVTFDGIVGKSFVEFLIDSIGLGLSAQDFAAEYYANGGSPGDILTGEGPKAFEQRKEIREGWEKRHSGKGNRHRIGVLWGGWKWQSAGGVDSEKAQALESRQFNVEEAARYLGMPPHLLRDLSRATFSNIEEQGIDAVIYTWQPICTDYEQEYDRKLLDSPRTFSKHNLNGLMRGNSVARSTFYKEMFMIGGVSINEVLDREDENGIGPMGDLRFVPLNMQTLEEAQRKSEEPPAPEPVPAPMSDTVPPMDNMPPEEPPMPPEDNGPGLTAKLWMTDTLERLMKKECNALHRAATQPETFLSWMETFYDGHQAVLSDALKPVVTGCALATESVGIASQWVERSKRELLGVYDTVSKPKFQSTIEELSNTWKANRTAQALASMEIAPCQN